MAWIRLRLSNYKQMAPLVRTGGPPHRNIHQSYYYIHPAKALSAGYILCVPHFFQLQPWIPCQNLLQQSLRKLQKISSVRCLSRGNPALTGNVYNPVLFQIQIKMSKKMQQFLLPQMKQRSTGPDLRGSNQRT